MATYEPMIEIRAMAASLCIDHMGRIVRPSAGAIDAYVRGPQGARIAGMRHGDACRLIEQEIVELLGQREATRVYAAAAGE